MRIDLELCVLRPYEIGDAESLTSQGNNPMVAAKLRDRFPSPYTTEDAHAYIEYCRKQPPPQTSYAIVVDDQAVGGISVKLGEDIERVSAEIGYWLGEAYWGRGIMTQAVTAFTTYAIESFNLARVFALPFADSAGSIRVLEKSGYRREGLLHRSAIKNGKLIDQVMYAFIATGDL